MLGSPPIFEETTFNEDSLRTEATGGSQGHAGMQAEGPSLIRGSSDDTPSLRLTTNHHRFTPKIGVIYLLHGDEEGVEVNVHNAVGHCNLHPDYSDCL